MPKTPAEWIESFIPAQYDAVEDQLSSEQKAQSFSVGISIDGNDGGQWTVAYANGTLTTEPKLEQGIDLTVETDASSFHAANDQLPSEIEMPTQQLDFRLKPAMADQLRQIRGTLRLALLDEEAQVMWIKLKFGTDAPADPTCDVTLQQHDLEEMVRNHVDPQQAMLSGKVKIKGDMALLMQLAAIVM